jgi:hypothetical protein
MRRFPRDVWKHNYLRFDGIWSAAAESCRPVRSKTWTWGGANEAITYRYLIDRVPGGGPTGAYSAVTTATQAGGNGLYYLHVQAKDAAGNESAVVTVHALLDNTAPVVTGLADDPGPLQAKIWTWGGTDVDTALQYRHGIDKVSGGVPGGGYGSAMTATKAATDGTWYLHVQARDRAGNESAVVTASVLLDNTAPAPPSVGGVTPVHTSTPTWTWASGGGGNGQFRYQLDGTAGAWSDTTALSFTPGASLSDGSHTLYVQERDTAGNWSASGWCAIRIDTVLPAVTGLSPAHGPAAGGTIVVITGTGLASATEVRFGMAPALSFTQNSATQITATAPAGTAGQTVAVSVTTPVATSADTAADDFTYGTVAVVGAAEVAEGHGLWDLSGTYATAVGGNPLTLVLVHDTRGRLTGRAMLQTNVGMAVVPVFMAVKGSVTGRGGSVVVTLRLKGTDALGRVGASLAFDVALTTATRQLSGPVTGSLTMDGVTARVAETVAMAVPASMEGTWWLLFDLVPGAKVIGGTATLTLSNGAECRFAVTGRSLGSGAVLTLTGLPSDLPATGIRIRTTIETLAGGLTELDAFSGRGYGQTLVW